MTREKKANPSNNKKKSNNLLLLLFIHDNLFGMLMILLFKWIMCTRNVLSLSLSFSIRSELSTASNVSAAVSVGKKSHRPKTPTRWE